MNDTTHDVDYFRTVANLLRRYDGSRGDRSDFRRLMGKGEAEGVSSEHLNLIEQARDLIRMAGEGGDSAENSDVFSEWLSWQIAARDLPQEIGEALLHRLPLSGREGAEWAEILSSDAPSWLGPAVVTRNLILIEEIRALAESHPADFYRSPLLDAMLARGSGCPDAIWDQVLEPTERPGGLLAREEVLVKCLSCDGRKGAVKRFLAILGENEQLRRAALSALLQDSDTARRVLHYLLFPPAGGQKDERKQRLKKYRHILVKWVQVATDAVEDTKNGAEIGALVVASAVVAAMGLTRGRAKTIGRDGLEELSPFARRVALTALRGREAGTGKGPNLVVGLDGEDLYRIVHEHLGSLPKAQESLADSPDRRARYERFKGRREVLEEILVALEEEPAESPLRDAMEVALFNSGVRKLEARGKEVRFDSGTHHCPSGGVLPGDRAKVVAPGRCLGDADDRLVLRRATVEAIE